MSEKEAMSVSERVDCFPCPKTSSAPAPRVVCAPTGVGSEVVAEAVLEKIDGRFLIFRVTARDQHQQIGDGYVHRTFVSVGRFMGKQGMK